VLRLNRPREYTLLTKQHELLAVKSNVVLDSSTSIAGLVETFQKSLHHFTEERITFHPAEEGAPAVTEKVLNLQTDVHRELERIRHNVARAIDVNYQIALGNVGASADVVLDGGKVLFERLPATALLDLKNSVQEIRALVLAIPTLDPVKGFDLAPERGAHVYKARDVERNRTVKTQKHMIVVPATTEHPAQVGVISEDIVTGHVQVQEWSGLITPAEKGAMLDRVESVSRAVKAARARANEFEIDVKGKQIGNALLGYIFGF